MGDGELRKAVANQFVSLTPLLDEGRPPAEWVELLAARGLEISERTLREKANRLRACHKLGRAMIITAEQLDTILKDGTPCPSKSTSEAQLGGRKVVLNITARPSPNITDAAQVHLLSKLHGNGAPKKRHAKSVVTLSGMKKPKGR